MGTNCGTLSARDGDLGGDVLALEREQLIARMYLPRRSARHGDIRDLAANESERKSGIRKVSEGRKSPALTPRQKIHWARCWSSFWFTTRFMPLGRRGIPGLFKPSLPFDIEVRHVII